MPNSDRARAWTRDVLDRSGGKCAFCGSESLVQAHHIMPRAWFAGWGSNYRWLLFAVCNGVALCGRCHLLEHPNTIRAVIRNSVLTLPSRLTVLWAGVTQLRSSLFFESLSEFDLLGEVELWDGAGVWWSEKTGLWAAMWTWADGVADRVQLMAQCMVAENQTWEMLWDWMQETRGVEQCALVLRLFPELETERAGLEDGVTQLIRDCPRNLFARRSKIIWKALAAAGLT